MSRTLNIFLTLLFTLLLFGCGGGGGGGHKTTPSSARTLTGVQISTATADANARGEVDPVSPLGIQQQFQALANYSDGSSTDVTSEASWNSSDPAIATMNETGLATPLKLGSATITASFDGMTSNSSTLTVTDAVVTKLQVIPPAPKLAKNLKLQLQALATFSDNSSKDVSSQASWVSQQPTLLSIDSKTGIATAKAVGKAAVSATLQGVTGQASITVTNATVSAIQISSATRLLAKGTKSQLTATATLSDKSTQDISNQVAWLSSNPTVATVNNLGLLSGVAAGSTTISASLFGVTGNISIMVSNSALSALQVLPASSKIANGTQAQFRAIATFADHSTQDISQQVSWSSSNIGVATVNSSGLVTGKAVGQAVVEASFQTLRSSATLTVTAAQVSALQITPASQSLAVGLTQQYQAVATFDDGSTQDVGSQVSWNSSDPAVATIDLHGKATSIKVGTALITASFANMESNEATLTVSDIGVTGLSLSIPASTLAAGTSTQLKAIATLSDGSTSDVTTDVQWSSSNPAVASVSGSGLITAIAKGTATITGQLDGQISTQTITVTDAIVIKNGLSLSLEAALNSLPEGTSTQLKARASFSDGTNADVTSKVSLSSSNETVATVTPGGLINAVAPGTTTITASFGGQTGTLTLTVTDATLSTLQITPASRALAVGLTQQYQAIATFNNGSTQDVSSQVSWTSSDPAVATMGPGGKATAIKAGTALIKASLAGIASNGATLTVSAASVTGLSLSTPASLLAAGTNAQLQAMATLSDGSTSNVTADVQWSSSAPAVASVSDAGLVTAIAKGAATITASFGGRTGTLTLTVTDATLSSLQITPATQSLVVGLTQQYQAIATFDNGNTQDVSSQVRWISSDPAVATLNPNGKATAIKAGTTLITASLADITSNEASLTVSVASVTGLSLSTSAGTLAVGTTAQLKAIATLSDGSTNDVTEDVQWSSSAPAVANVNDIGLVTALTAGSTTITGRLNGQTSTLVMTVTNAIVINNGLALSTGAPFNTLSKGTSTQLEVRAAFSNGTNVNVTNIASLSSSDEAVATVTPAGLIRAVAPGTATLTASFGGQTGSLTLTVTDATLSALQITPASQSLVVGLTQQYQAIATFDDGSTQDVSSQVSWISSDHAVATIDLNGKVTAIKAGTALITASLADIASNGASLTVSAASVTGLSLSTSAGTLAVGTTAQLQAIATLSDGSTNNVTADVQWSSSAPAVANVNGTGLVTALTAGSATLTGQLNGQTGTLVVTVTNAVVINNGLALSTGAPLNSLPKGTSTQLRVDATFSDGTSANVTAQASLSSSDEAVATVTPAGLIHAVAPGAATLTASFGGQSSTLSITVTEATLSALQITPASQSLVVGLSQQYQAIAMFTDGSTQEISNQVSWSSSDTAVATLDLNGKATAIKAGTTLILARLAGMESNEATLTISDASVTGLNLATSASTLAAGTSAQLTAIATLSNGSTNDVTTDVQWSSNAPAVAHVSDSGLVTALAAGSATITGQLNGQTSTLAITVTNAVVINNGLALSTGAPLNSLPKGTSTQLRVDASFSDGTSANVTVQASLSSSDTTVATVTTAGLIQAVAPGTTTLTASFGGQSSTLAITVTNATLIGNGLTLSTGALLNTLPVGTNTQLTVSAIFTDGTSQNVTAQASLSSDNTAVATITPSGLIAAVAPGTATISAGYGGQSKTLTVTVTPTVLTGIQITPPAINLVEGLTQPLEAIGLFDNGTTSNITGLVSWAVTPVDAALIRTDGLLTALLPATGATVKATLNGVTSNLAQLNIISATLNHLEILNAPVNLVAGLVSQLRVNAVYDNGLVVDVTDQVSWNSSNPLLATVVNGLVSSLLPGPVTLTAQLGSISAAVNLNIDSPSLDQLTVEGDLSALPFGIQRQLQAFAKYSNAATPVDVTTNAQWSSSNAAVIAVDNLLHKGRIEARATSGTASISVSFNGVSSQPTAPIPAAPSTVNSVAVQGGASGTLVVGTSVQLAAKASLSGLVTPQDVTQQTSWTSSNTAVLTVTPQGLVSAVGPGSATIKATYSGVSGTQSFTVSSAVLSSLNVTCTKGLVVNLLGIPVANLISLKATGHYNNGSSQDLTNVVSWTEGGAPVTIALGSTRTVLLSDTVVYTASKSGVTGSVTALSGCN